MEYPNYKWVDVAYGGVANRNTVVTVNKVKRPKKADCFRTVYRYPEAFKEHFDKKNTVSGYDGHVYADFMPIDIDKEGDLEGAQKEARKALNILLHKYNVNLKELWIYFSGNKGFHILIPAEMIGYKPSKNMPDKFKGFVSELLPEVEIDLTIYDKLRLFRISNTKHGKSGLYKIGLYAREILNSKIDDILKKAEKKRDVSLVREHDINEQLKEIYDSIDTKKREKEKKSDNDETDGPPKFAKLCYYKILKGVKQGERDNSALRLAVHLRKQGYDRDMVGSMLVAWNKKNNPSMNSKEIQKSVRQAFEKPYDFGCNDVVLSKYCDPRCYIKNSGDKNDTQPEEKIKQNIYSLEEAYDAYSEYISYIDQKKVKIGIPLLDKYMRGIAPGEACQIMARAGVGKTALMLNILSHVVVQQRVPSLVFSLEMPVAQIFERMVQISNAKKGKDVEKVWKTDEDKACEWFSNTVMNFGSSYIIDDDFLRIEDVYRYFELAEEKIGEKPAFVCLDYLGRMKNEAYNVYEGTSELAKKMKNMARELGVALVYLHQTSRAGGDGTTAITMDMARDSGVVEEASDFMIGLWRPDMRDPDKQKNDIEAMKVALLKNRKGPNGVTDMLFHKKSLIIDGEEKLVSRGLL